MDLIIWIFDIWLSLYDQVFEVSLFQKEDLQYLDDNFYGRHYQ